MTVKNRNITKQLLTLAKTEKIKRLAVRIQAVALAKQGFSCPKIAQNNGYSLRSIQRWIARYNQTGIRSLIGKPRTGHPTKLSVDKQQQFCERVDAGLSDAIATLYGRNIRQILEMDFGVIYMLDGVYKLLHRQGYSRPKPRPRHQKADPQAQKEFKKTSRKGSKK